MNIADIRKLHWSTIDDWSYIPKTCFGKFRRYISKSDINNFITQNVRILARKLCVDYNELYKLISDENEAFYSIMDELFQRCEGVGANDEEFLALQEFFRVPCLPYLHSDPVASILLDFEKLNDRQKEEVLSKLKSESTKVIDAKINIE